MFVQIASQVPGQTAETCRAMAQQIAFDKSAGTRTNFFGGNIEVKVRVRTTALPVLSVLCHSLPES